MARSQPHCETFQAKPGLRAEKTAQEKGGARIDKAVPAGLNGGLLIRLLNSV
jgi:hypothetical protein